MTDVVAVEHKAAGSELVKFGVNAIGNGAFAAAAEASEPDDGAARSIDGVIVPGDECFFGHGFCCGECKLWGRFLTCQVVGWQVENLPHFAVLCDAR